MNNFFNGLQVEVTTVDVYKVVHQIFSGLSSEGKLSDKTHNYISTVEGEDYYKYLVVKNLINKKMNHTEEMVRKETLRSVLYDKVKDLVFEAEQTEDAIIDVLEKFTYSEEVAKMYGQQIYKLWQVSEALEQGKKVYRSL